jgi:hypothetical protein
METSKVINEHSRFSTTRYGTDEIVHHILKIGQLSRLQDNWDSYGGKAISVEVGEKAAKYLYAAFRELSDEMESVSMPFIAPANDGSVVFEWSSQKVELIVVFRPNTQIDVEYLTVKKANGKETEKEGKFDSIAAFVQAVKWFSANKI